jgi:hypothetical protein
MVNNESCRGTLFHRAHEDNPGRIPETSGGHANRLFSIYFAARREMKRNDGFVQSVLPLEKNSGFPAGQTSRRTAVDRRGMGRMTGGDPGK